VIESDDFFCFTLSTPTGSLASDFNAQGCVLYYAYGKGWRGIRELLEQRCGKSMYTPVIQVTGRNCSHVHKECACPYMARQRSLSAGGSCSHVHEECARPYMRQRRWMLTGGSCSHVHKECACPYMA
jgi:hypothetical protein